jgi:iron complex outermembrane receptor protein
MGAEPLFRFKALLRARFGLRLRAGAACALVAGAVCGQVPAAEPSQLNTLPAPADAGSQPAGNKAAEAASPVAELENLLQSKVESPALQQEVTTVSGQESTVGRSPAAVFVITQEMIRRSGATCIPEVLRMAPGIQVARINSSQWAITSRGFNANIAGLFANNNKLLILIDGRTVYTPFFNGTYWDVQDVLLADVDRIEVIRGPGATIWGANAMNGVINIITKRAADTQGGLLQAGGGTSERSFTNGQIGGQSGNDVYYRAYGKWFERDASFNPVLPETDDWRQGRGGFRTDWTPSTSDLITLQGDAYAGQSGFLNTALSPAAGDDERVQGANLLTRWTRKFNDDSDVSLQLYYDRADRLNDLGFLDQEFNTYDLDFRHHFQLNARNNVIWGLGYRSVSDDITSLTAPPATVISFDPAQRTYNTASTFVQDEITLKDDLFLTLGTKLEHNDFTGWEVQPSVRLLYSPEKTWAAWAAISRAVRTPSRIEQDGQIAAGTIPILQFVPTFQSENLIAYELGYRSQPAPWYSWDIAVFYNQYDNLESVRATDPTFFPIFNTNDNSGEGYGVELSNQLDVTPHWRMTGAYSFLQLEIHPGKDTVDFLGSKGELIEGLSPQNQAYLMSSHELGKNLECDIITRYVEDLPIIFVHSYVEMDVRLAWKVSKNTELSIVGQNLLDPHHPEYPGQPASEIKRGVYGMITRTW